MVIKHAHRTKVPHNQYKHFLDYGDGEDFDQKTTSFAKNTKTLTGKPSLPGDQYRRGVATMWLCTERFINIQYKKGGEHDHRSILYQGSSDR